MVTDYRLFVSGKGIGICCVRTAARAVAIVEEFLLNRHDVVGLG